MIQTAHFETPSPLQASLLEEWEKLSQCRRYPASTEFDLFQDDANQHNMFVMELADTGWRYASMGMGHQENSGSFELDPVDLFLECDDREQDLLSLYCERRFSFGIKRLPQSGYGGSVYTRAIVPITVPASDRPTLLGVGEWYDADTKSTADEEGSFSAAIAKVTELNELIVTLQNNSMGCLNQQQARIADLALMSGRTALSELHKLEAFSQPNQYRELISHRR